MKRLLVTLFSVSCISFAGSALAESQDIMLLPLSTDQSGYYQVELKPFHLTYRGGYDNQPKFSQSGDAIFFTRMQSVKNATEQQTDIYQFVFENKQLINVTQTEEHSEYSATPYTESSISIIGVNPEGKQYLRKVELSTAEQSAWRKDIEPVGYHAWLNPEQAAVFVLGEVMTLQILDTQSSETPEVLAENIGRCFETIDADKVSFTIEKDGIHHLQTVSSKGDITSTGIQLPQGVQDYAWLDAEHILVGKDSKLMVLDEKGERLIADLNSLGVQGITRLAISPDKTKLALVYSRP
ncbi:hypothetical protein [Kangiella shandongensis]|uniref:hypothetical protein n=1 Tax=Kangiella shandongensis TaxID=2763258 RepID=UPI001CBD9986|nr:hypothetical protein [Kangiella shandongensis]